MTDERNGKPYDADTVLTSTAIVGDDVTEDVPPMESDTGDNMESSSSADGVKVSRETPEQKHRWGIEEFKNSAAFKLVAACLIVIAVFALIEFFYADNNDALTPAAETFKVVRQRHWASCSAGRSGLTNNRRQGLTIIL